MNKMTEFKDQTSEELKSLFLEESKAIFEMRNELRTTRKLEKPHLLREKKRTRARILTVLNSRAENVRQEG